MAKAQYIAPFPDDIDRIAFGSWLSGFVDGEGCFYLQIERRKGNKLQSPRACFRITLRHDDLATLQLIQSFWRCGILTPYRERKRSKPIADFHVMRLEDVASVVVPHFQQFPLFGKKRRDYLAWVQAVSLISAVRERGDAYRFNARRCGATKWTHAEVCHFIELADALKHSRRYAIADRPAPEASRAFQSQRGLLDMLN